MVMIMKKKSTRLMLAAAAVFLSVYMLAGAALADSSTAGTVNVGTYLNMRQSNTSGSAIIGKLNNGAKVTVLSSAAGWYHISFNGQTGWVSGHYLTLESTAKVNSYLNIRQSASSAAAVTGRLYNATLVTITDSSSSGWFKISCYGGTGWVNGQYLELGNAFISGSANAQAVTDAAQRVIGVKYVFGGTTTAGFDCSGLSLYAYGKVGISLPHSAAQQAALGTAVSRANLQPGDLVFFDTDGGHNNITHVGVYIGGNMFINAETGSMQRVNECSLDNSYWSAAFMTARRII
jgi:cell wall-associated NlpC family hydrolase